MHTAPAPPPVEFLKRLVVGAPLTLLGVGTLTVFYGVALLPASVATALTPLLRVIIIPMWAGWDLGMLITDPVRTAIAHSSVIATVVGGLAYLCGFLPYVLGDAALYAIRRRQRAGA